MSRTQWTDFLAQQHLTDDGESFGNVTSEVTAARDAAVIVPLTDFGVIRASGEDAADFLHNLLTNDIKNLPQDSLRFAGFCTPKGRLLATFHIWHAANDLLLALAADIHAAMLKKLSMYILRSKVKLSEAEIALYGVAGPQAANSLRQALGSVPEPGQIQDTEGGQLLALSSDRFILALDYAAAIQRWPTLTAHLRPAGSATWRWVEIAAGQPRVVAATQEAFVPQMVNMEVANVAGVSFGKGCYPGQEIVARTQYLGKVKRRMYRAHLDQPLPAGKDVFTPESGDQHCGALVTVAPAPAGGYDCLVVVQSSGAEAGNIYAGGPGTPPQLALGTQPYPVD